MQADKSSADAPVDKDGRAIRSLDAHLYEQIEGTWYLIGSRCPHCGDIRFPAAIGCPVCHAPGADLVAHTLNRDGVVFTFSRVEKATPPYMAPYVLAWIQVRDGPRVFCQLECEAGTELFGRRCEVTVGPLFETEKEIGLGFK